MTSSVASLALLGIVGLIAASGATTGALWKDRQPVDDGLVVIAGDLDMHKCGAADSSYWEETATDLDQARRLKDQPLRTLVHYPAMPGDRIKITQCVELTLSGDNLATKLSVQWGDLTSGGILPDHLVDMGVDPDESKYWVSLPSGSSSQGIDLTPPVPVGTDAPVGIEPATFQGVPVPPGYASGPPGDRLGPIRWNIEIEVVFTDLVSGPVYTPQPPIVDLNAVSPSTPNSVEIPSFTIVANQTRTAGEGF